MPENEFEKEVQQKMEGFKINPSVKPWAEVSATILQQKSRRRKFLLFFIFIFFLLAGTIFLSDIRTKNFYKKQTEFNSIASRTNNNTVVQHSIIIQNNNSPKSNNNTSNNRQNDQRKISLNPGKNVQQQVGTTEVRAINSTGKQLQVLAAASAVNKKSIKKIAGRKTINISNGTIEATGDSTTPSDEIKQEQQNIVQDSSSKMSKQISLQKEDTAIKNLSDKKLSGTLKSKENVTAKVNPEIKKNKKSKWHTAILISGGISSTGKGYLGSDANLGYDYTAANPTNNGGGNYNYTPSAIKSKAAFIIGLSATHALTSKSNIIIGLNYKFFTTSLNVGKDSLVNFASVYSVGNTSNYSNHYHFIEVPVSFQTQIININKHPLYLEAGISVSQLLSTNALQFNALQGIYFRDNSFFHKTLIGLSAGLSINILNQQKAPLLIGPQVYYSATPLAGTGFYAKTHYSFAGIRLQKMLRKN